MRLQLKARLPNPDGRNGPPRRSQVDRETLSEGNRSTLQNRGDSHPGGVVQDRGPSQIYR
jgi:hypothetical protein